MKTYKKVYFRIEAGYKWGKGIESDALDRFNTELSTIFPDLGFWMKEKRISMASDEYVRGQERLYCHPMNISGELLIDSIQEVEKALQNRVTFKFLYTDVYEDLFLYEGNELQNALDKEKEYIGKALKNMKNSSNFTELMTHIYNIVSCLTKEQKEFVDTYVKNLMGTLIVENKSKNVDIIKGCKNIYVMY